MNTGPERGTANGPADEPVNWDDRLVDRALQELHGDRPPDLVAAVTERLRGPRQRVAGAPRRSGGHANRWLAAAALVAAALAGAAMLGQFRDPAPIAAAQIEIQVSRGELAIAAAARAPGAPLRPPTASVVLLRRGDRLHAAAATVTEAFVGPFGMVRTEPNTVLEVVDMDVRIKNGWVAAGSLSLAVVAGAASWHWITQRGSAEAGEVLRLETPSTDGVAGEQLLAARAESDRLRDENEALRRRLEDVEAKASRHAAPAVAPATEVATADPAAEPAPSGEPVFDDERYADLLRAIDLKVMGEVADQMGIPLVELMKKLEAGEELPLELAVKIGKLNMQLVEQLPKILEAGLAGSGPNGAYTHPLIVGNQLASLLQSAGVPLNASQRGALAALVRHFAAENDGIHEGPAELELDRLVAEVAMKDRMYDELAQQLSPEQLARVYPEGAGTFDGTSLFRSGLIWQTMAAPINVADAPSYVTTASQRLTEQLHFDSATAARVRAIVEQAARAAPNEIWAPASGAELSQARFLRAGRATRAAQMQQAWMRRVLREVPLTAQQREQLRTMQRVFVPLPR